LSCKQKFNVITSLYAFLKKEVSGITYIPESKLLWVIEDSGNANKIYGLNPKGKLEKSITIRMLKISIRDY
jgi:uncharacterized protein YjiK